LAWLPCPFGPVVIGSDDIVQVLRDGAPHLDDALAAARTRQAGQ